jgi:pimeloyl-ACP methyl ester carboxylesterase
MTSDAQELVTYSKTRFGVGKIYLMGFSSGTIIGLSLAERSPQDFYAYIAVSQEINTAEAERISLAFVRQAAEHAGDQQALTELAGIDPAYHSEDWFRQITTERKWLLRYGGVYRIATSYTHEIWMLLRSHEYSLVEAALWPGRSSASLKQMWPEVLGVNFFDTVPALNCPVYFFVGRHDLNVPGQFTSVFSSKWTIRLASTWSGSKILPTTFSTMSLANWSRKH